MQAWDEGVPTRRASRSARRSSARAGRDRPRGLSRGIGEGARGCRGPQPGRAPPLLRQQGGALHGDPAQARRGRRHDVRRRPRAPDRGVLRRHPAQRGGAGARAALRPGLHRGAATPSIRRTRSSSSAATISAASSAALVRDEQAAGQHRPDIDPDASPGSSWPSPTACSCSGCSTRRRHGRPRRLPLAPRHAQGLSGCRRPASCPATCAVTTSRWCCSTSCANAGPSASQRDRRCDRTHARRGDRAHRRPHRGRGAPGARARPGRKGRPITRLALGAPAGRDPRRPGRRRHGHRPRHEPRRRRALPGLGAPRAPDGRPGARARHRSPTWWARHSRPPRRWAGASRSCPSSCSRRSAASRRVVLADTDLAWGRGRRAAGLRDRLPELSRHPDGGEPRLRRMARGPRRALPPPRRRRRRTVPMSSSTSRATRASAARSSRAAG